MSSESGKARVARKAVGYLVGRGGTDTLTASAAIEEHQGAGVQLLSQLQSLSEELQVIDLAIENVGAALNRAQPPMYGRFAVRWWKLYGGAAREPVLVRETGGPSGLLKPELVKTRGARQRTDGGFGLNADLAKQALDSFWLLKHQRKTVQQELAAVSKVLGRERGARRVAVTQLALDATAIQDEAERRLVAVGAVDRQVDRSGDIEEVF